MALTMTSVRRMVMPWLITIEFYLRSQLHNYFGGSVIIRCSLVSDTPPHFPHPHILDMALGQSSGGGGSQTPPADVQLTVGPENDYTASYGIYGIYHATYMTLSMWTTCELLFLTPQVPRPEHHLLREKECAKGAWGKTGSASSRWSTPITFWRAHWRSGTWN